MDEQEKRTRVLSLDHNEIAAAWCLCKESSILNEEIGVQIRPEGKAITADTVEGYLRTAYQDLAIDNPNHLLKRHDLAREYRDIILDLIPSPEKMRQRGWSREWQRIVTTERAFESALKKANEPPKEPDEPPKKEPPKKKESLESTGEVSEPPKSTPQPLNREIENRPRPADAEVLSAPKDAVPVDYHEEELPPTQLAQPTTLAVVVGIILLCGITCGLMFPNAYPYDWTGGALESFNNPLGIAFLIIVSLAIMGGIVYFFLRKS